jgi:hypothetical protein
MSRGLGQVQRSILVLLRQARGEIITVDGLAEGLWGRRALQPVTRAHRETVRRALLTLEQRGLADLYYAKDKGETGEIRRHLAAVATREDDQR